MTSHEWNPKIQRLFDLRLAATFAGEKAPHGTAAMTTKGTAVELMESLEGTRPRADESMYVSVLAARALRLRRAFDDK
jgi:hypothetical protein